MKAKKINLFKILLYTIYIFSIIFFLFKGEYGKIGMSAICLITLFLLNKIYLRNPHILDKILFIVGNLFILFSFLLGSSYELYDKIKYYDDFLHFWSGFISIKIGWNLLNIIKAQDLSNKILFFIVLFLFAMGISAICEISEYLLDTFFKMQTRSGGLKDTMHDMIDALLGSLIMIIFYYRKLHVD